MERDDDESEGRGPFVGCHYCERCWTEYLDLPAQKVRRARPRSDAWGRPAGKHYDFIEVGTSDWGTVTQFCAGDYERGSRLGSEIRTSLDDLWNVQGLAVEAVKEHLDALPSLPRVKKVNAAMDERGGGKDVLFCVSGADIRKHMGQYWAVYPGGNEVDVMWFAKSLSSIGDPHPDLRAMLRDVDRLDLLQARNVPVLSWRHLCEQHDVTSVDVVQIDCEGKDSAIVRGLICHCEQHPAAWPRLLQFEANYLTPEEEVDATIGQLEHNGYWVWYRSPCNVALERRWSLDWSGMQQADECRPGEAMVAGLEPLQHRLGEAMAAIG